jgi:hypothetical protein
VHTLPPDVDEERPLGRSPSRATARAQPAPRPVAQRPVIPCRAWHTLVVRPARGAGCPATG